LVNPAINSGRNEAKFLRGFDPRSEVRQVVHVDAMSTSVNPLRRRFLSYGSKNRLLTDVATMGGIGNERGVFHDIG
jgi:hypothetical protein